MISEYPEFQKLDFSIRNEVKKITSKYDPYSDFNFTSLFCWDVDGTAQVSLLNSNLVISLPDYISGELIYSILGKTKIDESLQTLLSDKTSLKLVPQVVIDNIKDRSVINVEEDRDNFDYIYSLGEHASFAGKKYKSKRNKINRFVAKNPDYTLSTVDITSPNKAKLHKEVFLQWAIERNKSHEEITLEGKAIDNFINSASHLDLIAVEMLIKDRLVGFSINEVVSPHYAVGHFQKTLVSHSNADVVLTNHVSQVLFNHGCEEINWEQDLGLPGLRTLKESYLPNRYLKKYTVSGKKIK